MLIRFTFTESIMFKTVILAGLLAASCAASAATDTWTFTYQGFQNQSTGMFSSDAIFTGSFSGNDVNRNGVIEKSELSSLFIDSIDYATCAAGTGTFFRCGMENFSYEIGGKLDFTTSLDSIDPQTYAGETFYYQTGVLAYERRFNAQAATLEDLRWTNRTQFAISGGPTSGAEIPAIPEPGTWAMLAAGLAVITGAALRRRPQAIAARRG